MTLEWSAAALADLDRFAAFLRERHPRLAQIVAAEIRAKAAILSEHPLIGRPIAGRPQFRELVLEVLNARYVFQYGYDGERLDLKPRYAPSPSPLAGRGSAAAARRSVKKSRRQFGRAASGVTAPCGSGTSMSCGAVGDSGASVTTTAPTGAVAARSKPVFSTGRTGACTRVR
jgi:plasmid stabilization system protein ParE